VSFRTLLCLSCGPAFSRSSRLTTEEHSYGCIERPPLFRPLRKPPKSAPGSRGRQTQAFSRLAGPKRTVSKHCPMACRSRGPAEAAGSGWPSACGCQAPWHPPGCTPLSRLFTSRELIAPGRRNEHEKQKKCSSPGTDRYTSGAPLVPQRRRVCSSREGPPQAFCARIENRRYRITPQIAGKGDTGARKKCFACSPDAPPGDFSWPDRIQRATMPAHCTSQPP
jgi:hypothetical protein